MITAARQAAQRHRDSIYLEDGEVLSCASFPGDQVIQRIRVPRCAASARPGSFIHVSCDDMLPMRRPLSIMRAADDWIEVLYKTLGSGLRLLAAKRPGDVVSVLGPIGVPFEPDPGRPNALLIGGGVGMPPMIFLADALRRDSKFSPRAILGSEVPFPFALAASALELPGADPGLRGTMPLLERWGVPARLASLAEFDGCHRGYVTELAERNLAAAGDDARRHTRIYACGPTAMLEAVAAVAARFEVPCDVSLEEFMACAVGGCAGCAVLIETEQGPAMKRVCVDGPVFDAASVVWG